MELIVVGIILIVIILYVVSVYNSLQRLKTQIHASIQEIGNQLKRQASLIPNLETAVKAYLKHEKGIFELLAEARKSVAKAEKSGSATDVDAAITKIQSMVPQLSVMVESNPQIQGDKTVQNFMAELSDTADKLMYARRTVIDLTQNYNQMLVTFPSNIIAKIGGFKPEKGLETPTSGAHLSVSDKEAEDVKVKL